jgi:membrane associated rhomboid family serine protease
MLENFVRTGPIPPLTVALIGVSVLLSLYAGLGARLEVYVPFFIGAPGTGLLRSVLSGELWRLLTPIFLHFGLLHLLFNMLWLWDLGGALEARRGFGFLALFVLISGIGGNLAQYLITGSPYFGGMSGVVFGLLGFIWMQGRYNPWAGMALSNEIMIMMLIWFVLGWTGLIGPIANWAHTGGLVIGGVWGYFDRSGNPFRRE